MLDVFGLKKEETQEPEETAPRKSSAKYWLVALVLDIILVVLFGGAMASRIYQHWKAPAPEIASKRASSPKPPKAAEAPQPEPPKPEAPKPPEPPKPEPPKAVEEPAKPLARPSLLSEAPRRTAPQPQATAAAPAPAGPQKAQPVEFKLKAPNAKKVHLVGAFIVRGGRKEMARGENGLWSLTLYLTPNTYRYHFAVDGKRVQDPENPGSSITVKPQ